ncbi:MAG: alkaline phosphatase [Chloroflexales bacterium]|nr:alkaline phosphatase [Chloroflexales bacterium]
MNKSLRNRILVAPLTRRRFLTTASALAGLALVSELPASLANAAPTFSAYPFTLGVASGDPLPTRVVIWTRLAPDPINGGGMPPQRVAVRWRVATDEQMSHVVRRGTAVASPDLAHSVHVDVQGLEPDRWYWYQFSAGSELSPIGRTRTAPVAGFAKDRFRFAFASCQDWQNGFYPAYRGMAEEDLDLVVFLGDYIYEYEPREGALRQHNGPEIETLEQYRNRYALYRTDRNLQAAHAAFPWAVTWDDHEVDNNYADAISEEEHVDPARFLERRANAYQAYYEHMPLRRASLPVGPDMQLFRRLTFGDLVEFSVLDTRQYRSDQPCADGLKPRCAAALSEDQTMAGPPQERWLLGGLAVSRARWNVIAQQTMLAQYDFLAGPGQEGAPSQFFNMDQWDGYVAARNRLLGFLLHRQPANPVVITGDIHSSWVHDLKADFDDPASATLGAEFVGASISSDFPMEFIPLVQAARADNPHTKFFDGAFRGYVRCELTPEQWRSDYRFVASIQSEDVPVLTLASFVVEDGKLGAERA